MLKLELTYNKKYGKNCENISQFFLFIGIIKNGDEIEEKYMCFISRDDSDFKWLSEKRKL